VERLLLLALVPMAAMMAVACTASGPAKTDTRQPRHWVGEPGELRTATSIDAPANKSDSGSVLVVSVSAPIGPFGSDMWFLKTPPTAHIRRGDTTEQILLPTPGGVASSGRTGVWFVTHPLASRAQSAKVLRVEGREIWVEIQ